MKTEIELIIIFILGDFRFDLDWVKKPVIEADSAQVVDPSINATNSSHHGCPQLKDHNLPTCNICLVSAVNFATLGTGYNYYCSKQGLTSCDLYTRLHVLNEKVHKRKLQFPA